MPDGHGGYRKPANPAPVSGPGQLARRTDGGPAHQAVSAVPDQPYGDAGQQRADQKIAPMAGHPTLPNVPATPAGGGGPPGAAAPQMPPYTAGAFNAPSNRPNEPVTAGVPIGPGPGPAPVQGINNGGGAATGAMTQLLSNLQATDTTGVLATLFQQAQARGA